MRGNSPRLLAGQGLSACLKTVASAILADVEPGFQPGEKNVAIAEGSVKLERYRPAGGFSGWQDATLHGRPGGPPLLFRRACLLYTSDAADERSSVDLGGR